MSYDVPIKTSAVSRAAMQIAKARLGRRMRKLDDCEVGDFVPCVPRQPGSFELNGKRFEVAETWVSNGIRAVPIMERVA